MAMSDLENLDESRFPPGTARLQILHYGPDAEIVLVPSPTADPNDPLNWSMRRKLFNYSLCLYYAVMLFVALDILPVIYGPLMKDLNVGANYGRHSLYLVTIAVNFGMAILAAKPGGPSGLYAFNFIQGIFGSASEAICQMSIADLFFTHQRGTMSGMYVLMQCIGSSLGPVIVGFIATNQNWPWIWWWTAIFLFVGFLMFLFGYEETKYIGPSIPDSPPTSLNPTADRCGAAENEKASDGGFDALNIPNATELVLTNIKPNTYRQRMRLITKTPGTWKDFIVHLYQPYIALFTIPGIAWAALIFAALLSWFSVLSNTMANYLTLPPYNFSPMEVGLMNLAPFVGSIVGSMYAGPPADFLIKKLAKRNGGIYEPEMRLWLVVPMVVILPLSIIWFGLCLVRGLPWPSLAIATGVFGYGMASFSDICFTYVIDSYQDIVGDAFVAVTFCRNGAATIVSTTLAIWIDGMGVENLFILCTCVCFGLSATTIPMLKWGKRFRINAAPRYRKLAANQFDTRGTSAH